MLVAYDGSTEARGAVARAGELAAPRDLVGVVNVMPEPGVSSRLAPYVDERRHQARLLDEAVRLLAERGIATRDVLVVHGAGGAAAERPAGSR